MIDFLDNFGVLVFRRKRGNFLPHVTIRVGDTDFHVDSYPGKGFNIITHAHSDHYGLRNVLNFKAVASEETAKILSIISGRKFRGITFNVGDRLNLNGVKIKTYDTSHIIGSAAFYFKDFDVLVTGDVKNYEELPKCSLLITEATYANTNYCFEDEIDVFLDKAEEGEVFGAYPVGKAQRAAKILEENGIGFEADGLIAKIAEAFGLKGKGGAKIVSTKEVRKYDGYYLSAQKFYRKRITLSDHLDCRGLIEMIEHCDPEHVIFYHGKPAKNFEKELRSRGYKFSTLDDLEYLYL
ncbi:mRNA 3'-end processing factor, putative [Ferroglobus placidus DSM 10642]|uniref:mRNA 3'-end processing factor, putative n=1 Tax=Ferroglobus placidus (strain DSM 10642 / AEDII12DO) TaxID=589924 RepID=D3RYG5_FERPA|nr:MBL fold metallo-hydrolase [Ferroglobus placidus]ADC65528.1 mRNA 3'-end processing factor, putative [Ferroglobus placidus DSM 10642]